MIDLGKWVASQNEIWSWVNSKSVVVRRDMRGVVRAEMFGQLTSGLEAAWNKLKGEGWFPLSFLKARSLIACYQVLKSHKSFWSG